MVESQITYDRNGGSLPGNIYPFNGKGSVDQQVIITQSPIEDYSTVYILLNLS